MKLSLITTNNMNSLLLSHMDKGTNKTISYSPFGGSAKSCHLPAGFNGQRSDPVSHCYHLGNGVRAYNPVLMRFNTPDSFSPFAAGGVNPYTYCLGDPINRSDPSGHISTLGTTTSLIGLFLGALSIFAGGAGIATIAFSLVSLATGAASVGLEIDASNKMDSQPAQAKKEQGSAQILGIISAISGVASMVSAQLPKNIFNKKTIINNYNNTSAAQPSAISPVNRASVSIETAPRPATPQPDYSPIPLRRNPVSRAERSVRFQTPVRPQITTSTPVIKKDAPVQKTFIDEINEIGRKGGARKYLKLTGTKTVVSKQYITKNTVVMDPGDKALSDRRVIDIWNEGLAGQSKVIS